MICTCNTKLTPALCLPTEAPEIDLDANLKQGLTVRAGCPIRLCATIRGRPPPKVTWRRMGIDNVVRKGKVDIIDTMTFLVIPDSTRNDSGKYCLTLQSPAGEKAVFVNVKVLGKFWFYFDTAYKFNFTKKCLLSSKFHLSFE